MMKSWLTGFHSSMVLSLPLTPHWSLLFVPTVSRRQCAHVDGAALAQARRVKQRTCAELSGNHGAPGRVDVGCDTCPLEHIHPRQSMTSQVDLGSKTGCVSSLIPPGLVFGAHHRQRIDQAVGRVVLLRKISPKLTGVKSRETVFSWRSHARIPSRP